MKINLIFFFFLLCIQGCKSNDAPVQIKKTIIAGKISNFENAQVKDFILIAIDDPFSSNQISKVEYVDGEGRFHFEIETLYPQEIYIEYKHLFQVYAFPGDSLFITINSDILELNDNNNGNCYKYIKVHCKNQQFQDAFLQFYQEIDDYLYDSKVEQEARQMLDYNEYKYFIEERTIKYEAFLSQFIRKNKTIEEFNNYGSVWIRSTAWEDLMRYDWLHPLETKIPINDFRLPKEYFNFLNDQNWNNEDLMIGVNYFGFLHEYSRYIRKYIANPDTTKNRIVFWRDGDKSKAINLETRYLLRHTSGFAQQVIMTKHFHRLLNWKEIELYDQVYDSTLIGRSDYIDILSFKYESLQKHVLNPEYEEGLQLEKIDTTAETKVFNTLASTYPGKVIYIDFWAPWCSPCMAEMPDSKKIQLAFKDKDVVFVFLASNCSEKSWKATISEKKLTGQHYLINEKEYAELSEKLQFSGIPHYIILDKNGSVAKNNAPRPSNEKMLKKLLTSLLSE